MGILRFSFLIICVTALTSFADGPKFDTRDVSVVSDASAPTGNCSLGASLTIPKQGIKALAVLIHGSGSIDRDGNIPGGFSTYKEIAEFLSSNGIAAIRFDKRSSIKECALKMNHAQFTYKIFVKDVVNVIKFAQSQPELSGLPTILVGHSQGVNFGSEIAADKLAKVDGLVLIAGLGRYAIDETIIRQLKGHLKNPQLPEETRKQYEKLIADGEVFFQKVRSGNYQEQDFFMGAFAPFWDEYIAFTASGSQIAKDAELPTLVLQGSEDTNVTKEDFDALVMATKNHVGSDSAWISDCHHLLAIPPSTKVADEVLVKIYNWINVNF